MRKLQRYILKNVLWALIPAFATLVLIMAAGFCMQLLNQGLDVVRLRGLLPPVIAYCIPMVLPSAFLTAVIMTFGRLSADNELIAVGSAGIHLFSLVYPVLALAVAVSLVAAFFQFETVPRARGVVKTLQAQALKQILLDRVALSTRRQMSFPRAQIQYDDVKDGQMINIVALEIRSNRARTVITAESGRIREHPEQSGFLLFEMKNCVITRLGPQSDREPPPLTSERAIWHVRVAREPAEILAEKRHLGLRDLLGQMWRLQQSVASQPPIDRPERVHEEQQAQRHLIDVQIGELYRTLEPLRSKYQKHAVQRPRQQQQLVERKNKLVADARRELESLQQQKAACDQELNEIQDEGVDNIDRQVELRRKQTTLLAEINARKKEIETLQVELAEVDKLTEDSDRRALEFREQIRELEELNDTLMRRRDKVTQMLQWADEQEELRSIKLRIHKRLVQSLSVLAFAMVGIPVGILASRRRVMTAFGISFAIVLLVFYPLLIVGQIAAEGGALPIAPAMWAGNGFMFIIGSVLMVSVMRR